MKISRLFSSILVASVLSITGCGTVGKMAFTDPDEKITPKSDPIFLMTTTIKNSYRDFQPKLLQAQVDKNGGTKTEDRLIYSIDNAGKIESDDNKSGNTYLLRFQLPAGEYNLKDLFSMTSGFLVRGMFITPLHSPIISKEAGVYYLGHAEAVVRERKGNEFRAGPVTPLIDQAITGASGGTFDIAFSDQWDAYEKTFRAKFKALEGVEVKKAILPAFDRAKAQTWWEKN